MRTILASIAVLVFGASPCIADSVSPPGGETPSISLLKGRTIAFTANRGQWDDAVLFRAEAANATLWFTHEGVTSQFVRRSPRPMPTEKDAQSSDVPSSNADQVIESAAEAFEQVVIATCWEGSAAPLSAVGQGLLEYRTNYFLGNDPAEWHTDVPSYSSIRCDDVYPGIDLVYFGNDGQVEYDFLVSPDADLSLIRGRYVGADSVSVNAAGELAAATDWARVIERAPVIYQQHDGGRIELRGGYELHGDGSFGFELREAYEHELALVVDPVLTYCTYLGGSANDWGRAIAVDDAGCAYVAGVTYSTNFPTVSPYSGDPGDVDADVVVTKMAADGSSPVYSTYLGGDGYDYGRGIAVDGGGQVYLTGETQSSNFPMLNAYDGVSGGHSDAFVTKLSAAGNSLVYSTYFGGSGHDHGRDIAIDGAGNAYIIGETQSSTFPTVNPYDATLGGFTDAFVAKLNSTGTGVVYSTYFGGGGFDQGNAIAVDLVGSAYVTGETRSTDFPTVGAYDDSLGSTNATWPDAFVSKFAADGSSLVYSTYLGGIVDDEGHGIAIDADGSAYVTGWTESPDFPVVNAYDNILNDGVVDLDNDAFVTKLSPSGASLEYSTFLGGGYNDRAYDIALGQSGAVCVSGRTMSSDFPTADPYDASKNGPSDAFMTVLSGTGSSLVYSTYLGGTGWDYGRAIDADKVGNVYLTGETGSSDFPTQNAYDATWNSADDVFVVKFGDLATSVLDDGNLILPDAVTLGQNYPNPFNLSTVIEYDLPIASHVRIEITNTLGQVVRVLVDGMEEAGPHSIAWDGRGDTGALVASGVYFYQIRLDGHRQARKMLLLK